MMLRAAIWAGLGVLVAAPTADAAKPLKPVYRSTKQVENYLEHQLKAWGGVNLAAADFKIVFCLQGTYSKAETRIGRKYPSRTTKSGEELYQSFACTLGADGRTFNLYVRPQAKNKWLIVANR